MKLYIRISVSGAIFKAFVGKENEAITVASEKLINQLKHKTREHEMLSQDVSSRPEIKILCFMSEWFQEIIKMLRMPALRKAQRRWRERRLQLFFMSNGTCADELFGVQRKQILMNNFFFFSGLVLKFSLISSGKC